MRLAILFSGGKDSTFALYKVLKEGHEVKYLITAISERSDSWMFHTPAIEMTKIQSEALGIERKTFNTKGEKEKELEDLKNAISGVKNEIDGVVTGAIASQYQKLRVDNICKELGLKSIAPLWQKNVFENLKEEISLGFNIIFTSVSAQGLDENWLGRKFDERTIEDLRKLYIKFGVHPSGEGGEYESLVLDCPIFKKKIMIENYKKIWDRKTDSGQLKIEKAVLVSKD